MKTTGDEYGLRWIFNVVIDEDFLERDLSLCWSLRAGVACMEGTEKEHWKGNLFVSTTQTEDGKLVNSTEIGSFTSLKD